MHPKQTEEQFSNAAVISPRISTDKAMLYLCLESTDLEDIVVENHIFILEKLNVGGTFLLFLSNRMFQEHTT
jgi:hypothetical protein